MVHHGAHGQRPSISAEEGHLAATQVPERPLHVVEGPQQVGLVARDPVQLQVQKSYAWNDPPREELRYFPSPFRTLLNDYAKTYTKPMFRKGDIQVLPMARSKKWGKNDSGQKKNPYV